MNNENKGLQKGKEKDNQKHLDSFINLINDRLNKYHISYRECSKRTGLSYGYVWNLLKGRRGLPTLFTIKLLSHGLNISEKKLLSYAGMKVHDKTVISNESEDSQHPVLSYKGKKIDKESWSVIKRILDSIPDPKDRK